MTRESFYNNVITNIKDKVIEAYGFCGCDFYKTKNCTIEVGKSDYIIINSPNTSFKVNFDDVFSMEVHYQKLIIVLVNSMTVNIKL